MQDVETGTLWSHILGEAMEGKLKGKRLESLPCFMTDWKTWLDGHPHTTVVMLQRTDLGFKRQMYFRSEAFGLGLTQNDSARFWRMDLLAEQPVVNDKMKNDPLLVVFDEASQSARVFSRDVDGRTLQFDQMAPLSQVAESLKDHQTGSFWDWRTGKALRGPMLGKTLREVPAIMTFGHAWLTFHPETTRWGPDAKP